MPYSLAWTGDRSIVTVTHNGAVTVGEIQRSLAEIANQSQAGGLPAMLIDVRDVTAYPDEVALMEVAQRNYPLPRVSRKTAFLADENTVDAIRFATIAASNRGFVVEHFADQTEAIRWLLD